MMRKDIKVIDSKVLILGFTFKEACLPKAGLPVRRNARKEDPNVRNTRVINIYNQLKSFDIDVCVSDPWADAAEVMHEYGIENINMVEKPVLDDIQL